MKSRLILIALFAALLVFSMGACDKGKVAETEDEDTVWTWEMCDSLGWDTVGRFHTCDTLLWDQFSAESEWEDTSGPQYAKRMAFEMWYVPLRGIKKMSPLIGRIYWLTQIDILESDSLRELPSEIWDIESLKILDILSTDSLKSLPEVRDTSSVKYLYLRNTNPTLPNSIGKTSITILTMWSHQPFPFPEAIRYIKTLQILSLGSDAIDSIPPWIVEIPSLGDISVAGSPVRHIPEYLFQLPHLVELDFYDTEITEIPEIVCDYSNVRFRYSNSKICQKESFPSCMESMSDSLIQKQTCN